MRKSGWFIVFVIIAFLANSCAKDSLDKTLDYNPFDPLYTGDSPFEFVDATPFLEINQENGQLVQKILVEFRVNESLFTSSQPFYSVKVVDEDRGQESIISSIVANNSEFQYEFEHPVQPTCIYLYLESGLSLSSEFEMCFTP